MILAGQTIIVGCGASIKPRGVVPDRLNRLFAEGGSLSVQKNTKNVR